MRIARQIFRATLAGIALIGIGAAACAQGAYGHEPGGPGGRFDNRGMRFDSRYHHDRYYPPRGYAVPYLPRGYQEFPYGREHFYLFGGIWYRPWGPRFQVIAPPFGMVVPFLPDFYTTVWFGGVPYYYANDTYYLWRRDAHGYVVTEPPPQENAAPSSAPTEDFFVYPRNGQSQEQQSQDRFECHQWASGQTGFDPSEPGGGVAEPQNEAKRGDYRRAMTACLEGRQYSVK